MQWNKIALKLNELNLNFTLNCGQSFRWKQLIDGSWISVLHNRIWNLKQDENYLYYRVLTQGKAIHGNTPSHQSTDQNILKDYFQLDVDLQELYAIWQNADKHFVKISKEFSGIRMLRQDPVENLFSFICSSNNHISRISGMVEKLCENYGQAMYHEGKPYYSFPDIESLCLPQIEAKLRKLGFGYRAKYIQQSAKMVLEKGGSDWLLALRDAPYTEAHTQLLQLPGVGGKVADCVCLMSLDKTHVVPVDTHVKQIAERDYKMKVTSKSLTQTNSKQIGEFFYKLWGPYAGWAHSVLFTADLKQFKGKDPSNTKKKKETRKRKLPLQIELFEET